MTATTADLRLSSAREARSRERIDLVGIWIFMGSAAVLFGTLLASYALLRAQQPALARAGLEGLPRTLAGLGTLALVLSSAALHLSRRSLARGLEAGNWIDLTLLLAIVFLALQFKLGGHLWTAQSTGTPTMIRSVFLLLLVAHGIHAVAALMLLLWAFLATGHEEFRLGGQHDLTRVAATLWHFLGAAWLAICITLLVT